MTNENTYHTFWAQLLAKTKLQAGLPVHPDPSKEWLLRVPHDGFIYFYVLRVHDAYVELWINLSAPEENEVIYQHLLKHRADIEAAAGAPLRWNPTKRPPKKTRCIQLAVAGGGCDNRASWPLLQDNLIAAMIRLQRACHPWLDV